MKTLNEYLNEKMEDPAFAKANKEIQAEMDIIRADVDAEAAQMPIQGPSDQTNAAVQKKKKREGVRPSRIILAEVLRLTRSIFVCRAVPDDYLKRIVFFFRGVFDLCDHFGEHYLRLVEICQCLGHGTVSRSRFAVLHVFDQGY
jgi:hypothetical protein